MKDLCRAMGWKWCDHKWVRREDNTYFCSEPGCWYSERCAAFYEHELPRNPSPTDEAFCWKALQYMMGREDWRGFHNQTWDEYVADDRTWSVCGFFPWLLTAPPDGKVRLVPLAARWCRERKEVKP